MGGNNKKAGRGRQPGRGNHTSLTAAFKKLLEEGHERHDFVAFSGISGGADGALLAWHALLERGESHPTGPRDRPRARALEGT